MRIWNVACGICGLVFGVLLEVVGALYGTDFVSHNAYGVSGGILAVLGLIAISAGRAPTHGITRPMSKSVPRSTVSVDSKYCTSCGRRLPTLAAYCGFCGVRQPSTQVASGRRG